MLARFLPFVALVVLVAAPSALAHAEPSPRIIQRVADGVVFSAEFDDAFVEVGTSMRGTGWFVAYADGEHPDAPLDALTASGPGGAQVAALFEQLAPGHFSFELTLPARGEWALEARLVSGERAFLPFTAYPEHPARVSWAHDAEWRFVQGTPARLAFRVDDEVAWSSAVARVEWWPNEVERVPSTMQIPLAPDPAVGGVSGIHRFNEPGLYALYVGSPERGLAPGDRPPMMLYVDPAALTERADVEVEEAARETPAPAGVGALVVAAALARAWCGRRR